MERIQTVHECLFCLQTFGSAIEKDDHTLEHFAHETCLECKENLVRIGGKLYVLHDANTCIKRSAIECDVKPEPLCLGDFESNDIRNQQKSECKVEKELTIVVDGIAKELQNIDNLETTNDMQSIQLFDEITVTNVSTDCNEVFSTNAVLANHQLYFTPKNTRNTKDPSCTPTPKPELPLPPLITFDGRYICDVCNNNLKSKSSLIRHKRLVHKICDDFVCKLCKNLFLTKDDLANHRVQCPKKQIKTPKPYQPYECDICKAAVRTKDAMRRHMFHIHVKAIRKQPHQCHMCQSIFRERSYMLEHIKFVHYKRRDFCCNVCGKTFKTHFMLKSHLYKHSGEKFKCSHCDKLFESPNARVTHIRRNHVQSSVGNPLTCDYCGCILKNRAVLRAHFRRQHINRNKFKCELCDSAFSANVLLRNHMRRHTGEKPFICEFDGCGKAFSSPPGRTEHMRVHTGEKPFLCTLDNCDKRFRFAVDFRRHKTKAHGVTKEAERRFNKT